MATPASETQNRIRQALALPSRSNTIHDVKRAVIEEFERVDRRVAIRSTEYFRHSFVPDLVLRWPDNIDREERWVYLRSQTRSDYVLDDLSQIARDQPIIFGLLPPEEAAPGSEGEDSVPLPPADVVRDRSSSAGTLVTDVDGLEALAPSSDTNEQEGTIPQLVSRLILRGGRGVYDRETSEKTTATINAGFTGAFSVDADTTFGAAAAIRDNLGDQSGQRLLKLLHAIWIGSGGRSDQFPEAPSLEGALSDDALELLLDGPEISNEAFWRRISTVTLAQLGRLNISDRPNNLARLVVANLDKIDGRACRVIADQPRTGFAGELQWNIERRTLALHGSNFTAYLAGDRRQLDGVPETVASSGITVTELTQRATLAEAQISDVTAAGAGLIIGVASDSHGNILDNPHTSESVQSVQGDVRKAVAVLRNTRSMVCDFTNSTASGRATRGTLTLRELVRHGLPLVWDLVDEDEASLTTMIDPVTAISRADSDQISLFDEVEQLDGPDDDGEDS